MNMKLNYKWEANFNALIEFKDSHGHCRVPKDYVTQTGLKLADWCRTQRKFLKKGTLSEERRDRLLELGFLFAPLAHDWDSAFLALTQFVKIHGHCRVHRKYVTQTGVHLGDWYYHQRELGMKNKLPQNQMLQLESIGFPFDFLTQDQKWLFNFNALARYKEDYGHCRVPQTYITSRGTKLGCWCWQQWRLYKQKKLSENRQSRLCDLGYIFGDGNRDVEWQRNFNALTQFVKTHGHCRVPKSYTGTSGIYLYWWLHRQRAVAAKGKLTEDRRVQLTSLGFQVKYK